MTAVTSLSAGEDSTDGVTGIVGRSIESETYFHRHTVVPIRTRGIGN
jgi:hypothetical protein